MPGMFSITGDKQLDLMLKNLGGKESNKAMSSAIRQGMTVGVRAIRANVPARYKSAKKAIGSRFKAKSTRKGQQAAKFGAAVGRKQNPRDRTGRPGVGISKNNIHWPILGTSRRSTKAGHNRGEMPAILSGIVDNGWQQSKPQVEAKMLSVLKQKIEQAAR